MGLGWGWNTTNTLNYRFDLGKNNFDILVGTEYGISKPSYGFSLNATASAPVVADMQHAYMSLMKNNTTASVSGNPYGDSKGMSYFGRLNYNYAEKYMFSAIMRADGSSIFAPGKRWGYFPSVSAGWVMSEEAFMSSVKDVMDYFKLRAGWGQNGNKNIAGAFQYEAAFKYDQFSNYSFGTDSGKLDVPTSGASLSRLANPDLTWETSEQINIGFDARFLNSRLNLNFDWYQKTTKDLLVYVPVSPTTGFSQALKNAGTVRNQGVEVALTWRDKIGSDFNYSIGYNVAYNKNQVTKVNSERKYNSGGENILSQGTTYLARFEEGQPIGYFWGYKTDGVIQNTADLAAYVASLGGSTANTLQGDALKVGDLKFVDFNGDGKIDSADRVYQGNATPDWTYSINAGFSWKGLTFGMQLYGIQGAKAAYVGKYSILGDVEGNFNRSNEILNSWTEDNRHTNIPRLSRTDPNSNFSTPSTWYLEDASFLRIKNVTVGYDLTRVLNKMSHFEQRGSSLEVYFSGENLFTFTKYSGMDPECGGWDALKYPVNRVLSLGVKLTY